MEKICKRCLLRAAAQTDVINDIEERKALLDVMPTNTDARKEKYIEEDFVMIDKCPVCGAPLVKKDAMHFCVSPTCPARRIEGMIHFSSRDAMDIETMGDKVCEEFFNDGLIDYVAIDKKGSIYKKYTEIVIKY